MSVYRKTEPSNETGIEKTSCVQITEFIKIYSHYDFDISDTLISDD